MRKNLKFAGIGTPIISDGLQLRIMTTMLVMLINSRSTIRAKNLKLAGNTMTVMTVVLVMLASFIAPAERYALNAINAGYAVYFEHFDSGQLMCLRVD
jgi:hypothetical protein